MIVSTYKAAEAANVLGIELDGLTPNALNVAYRERAKACHPDHHGNAQLALWARVSWAKECLTGWLEHRAAVRSQYTPAPIIKGDCRACAGTGRVNVPQTKRFGAPLTMVCGICRGLCTVIPEEDDHD